MIVMDQVGKDRAWPRRIVPKVVPLVVWKPVVIIQMHRAANRMVAFVIYL
jgi:hypothetical protein